LRCLGSIGRSGRGAAQGFVDFLQLFGGGLDAATGSKLGI